MDGSLKPLTDQERLLLSASLDGELDAAEKTQAEALMQRADARNYVKQLGAIRALVGKHGAANAPAALQARVMAALGEQPQGKVIPMPRATWATAIAALAAMLIVGTALYFAPGMIGPGPQEPTLPVARGNIARDADPSGQPATSPGESADPRPDTGDDYKARANGKDDVARDLDAEEASRSALPKPAARERDAAPSPPTVPSGQGGSADPRSAKKGDGGPADSPGKNEAEDKSRADAKDSREERDAEKRKEAAPGPAEAKSAKDEEQERETGKALRRAGGDDKRNDEGEKLGGGRAQWDDGAPEVVVSLKTESGLAAQNDVLRVGAMFGAASLGELPEHGMEDVIVEVEEGRLEALIASLQRLAGQQSYGKLDVPAELAKPAGAESAGKSARDVLPEDLRHRIEGKSPEPKPAAEANAPVRKVRLKVRLS